MNNNDKPAAAQRPDRQPAGAPAEADDNPLESIGKAIAEPVRGAAEDEEPGADGKPRKTPGP